MHWRRGFLTERAIMAASRAMKTRKRGVEYSATEIADLIRDMSHECGEPVTYHRFAKWSGIPAWQIYLHFRSWYDARAAAGLERKVHTSRCVTAEMLLQDLHKVVQHLRRWPKMAEFERMSGRTYQLLHRKIGPWRAVQLQYLQWLNEPEQAQPPLAQPRHFFQLAKTPTTVLWMCRAWAQARLGFELKSSDFRDHSPGDCDLLVVLDHDWPRCPVPVIEFQKVCGHIRPEDKLASPTEIKAG
jgi:hypothetical protein